MVDRFGNRLMSHCNIFRQALDLLNQLDEMVDISVHCFEQTSDHLNYRSTGMLNRSTEGIHQLIS